jgi:hypothetical protein
VKRAVAAVVTLVVVLAIVRWKSADRMTSVPLDSPAKCLQRMFESATQGDVEGYLGCFAEGARERFAKELAGSSAVPASESLRRSVADLKGWALLDAPAASESPPSPCRLTVEWVYATRVDKQQVELQRGADGWRIVQVESVRPAQPAIPYGTPVSELAPANLRAGNDKSAAGR